MPTFTFETAQARVGSSKGVVLNGFSAHADQRDLVEYAVALKEHGPLEKVALVRGEGAAQEALIAKMKERGFDHVIAPHPMSTLEI
jgi:metallo-beta-lactamase family protein